MTQTQFDLHGLLEAIKAGGDIDVLRRDAEMPYQALSEAELTQRAVKLHHSMGRERSVGVNYQQIGRALVLFPNRHSPFKCEAPLSSVPRHNHAFRGAPRAFPKCRQPDPTHLRSAGLRKGDKGVW